jgi:hypothetical protein
VLPFATVSVPDPAAGVVVVADVVVVVLVVVVGVVVDVPQDVNNIAATINRVKPNQINFFFISSPFFNYLNRLLFYLNFFVPRYSFLRCS